MLSINFKKFQQFAAFVLFALFAFFRPAFAQLVVDVNEGHKRPLQIAIADFAGPKGANISQVVRDDLASTGIFNVQDPKTFLAKNFDVNLTPKFTDWHPTKTEALVIGAGAIDKQKLRVEFRLWDIYGESQTLGLEFASTEENWRRIAHKIADAIYGRLTGAGGMFDTRVVYVAESGTKTKRVKRLALIDQDGANPSYLTDGSETILNPHFNASGQQIVYSALSENGLRLWIFDIETGRKEAITNVGENVFSARFSPDGQSIAYSSERDGNIEIMVKNLVTGAVHKLTNHPAIDTSPSFSSSQKQIVFTSDRSGSPQIYKVNIDGGGLSRISFGDGQYSTPVWSPKGDLIAFTKKVGGNFQIGIMKPDGSGEQILTSSYMVEGPSFSPNGRAIIFQREGAPGETPSLWTIDVSGANLRKIANLGSGSDPTWSPMLE